MSWLTNLYRTYDQIANNADAQLADSALTPYYHISQNAHIIVKISEQGKFLGAAFFRANDKAVAKQITLPATNDSANRTSGTQAHPLQDKLQYIAKDLAQFDDERSLADKFADYHALLTSWCHSEFAHPKAKAVLNYVNRGTLTQDLIAAGVLKTDDNGKLLRPASASEVEPPADIFTVLPKDNSKGYINQTSALVAWQVVSADLYDADSGNTWEDDTLIESWQQFYGNQEADFGLCYATGEEQPLANKHPKNILRSNNNAKLISANDNDGFTFRGKFLDGAQGAGVGSVVTEKAHAALSWLIRHQGQEKAGQAVVAWAASAGVVMQPMQEHCLDIKQTVDEIVAASEDAVLVFDPQMSLGDLFGGEDADDDLPDDNDDGLSNDLNQQTTLAVLHHKDIGASFAEALSKKMAGYRIADSRLAGNEQISIIVIEAATSGRAAVTYYQQMLADDYLHALNAWQEDFLWYQGYYDAKDNVRKSGIGAPVPHRIAEVCYGSRIADNLRKQVVAQVLPCIVEPAHAGKVRNIPYVLVAQAIKQACNPAALEKWEHEQAVAMACALYKGYCKRHSSSRNYSMALDVTYTGRDYLYGRLLAVAEDIESLALFVAGENRLTTAERYMQQFANRPFDTWRNIRLALDPYIKRLNHARPQRLHKREALMNEIFSLFAIADFNDNSPLSGEFLLGYHSQKYAFYLADLANKSKQNQENTTQVA
ncbi:type I-C CRISPR-associated protein Cas8c/Csd1 [Moraxella caviae]|uniref:CRISPR-associated protein Cas8c/Csd1, subtype I-C/DVULG n=1 Tax=Moraxella caviae TaxID=34060 RepID=A0A1T0A4P4_9GAMM|nr:type I-C CRISPR-associated protein Cas8c/Csd1 [Moraxella caviae]OOR90705.1 type I-C CRISPR-associated protein Cas8c/Csd1 [Moraxella caviae]STZ14853.1 CRISPR-associated protein Cas8c/Csd1, subtype I-C/DVULG [Moraxella caviae]